MIAVYINTRPYFHPRARYVFQTLFKIIGVPYHEITRDDLVDPSLDILFYYGSKPLQVNANTFIIQIGDCDYQEEIKNINPENVLWLHLNDHFTNNTHFQKRILYLFLKELAPLEQDLYQDEQNHLAAISLHQNRIHCSADIIASGYYFLTLENERLAKERDTLNRFHKSYSPLGQDIYDKPAVDHYVLLMQAFIQSGGSYLNKTFELKSPWPNQQPFCLALSHDVDRIRTWTFHKAKRALTKSLKQKNPGHTFQTGLDIVKSLLLKENWMGNFNFISQLEKKYGGRSTFFIVSKQNISLDPRYSLKSIRLRKAFHILKERACSIGLHGTIPSAVNREMLAEERELLQNHTDQTVQGLRQHYLCFDENKSWEKMVQAGFHYDSTVGFSNELGYRCGTSFPFNPYSHNEEKALPILEIPLTLMDTVLFLESKLYLSSEQAWEVILEHLQETCQNRGCLTLNWHNSDLNPGDVTGYALLYEKILAWAQEHGAWICSLDEVCEWWGER